MISMGDEDRGSDKRIWKLILRYYMIFSEQESRNWWPIIIYTLLVWILLCELFKKKRKSVSILLSLTPKIYRKLLLTRVMERISRKKGYILKGSVWTMKTYTVHLVLFSFCTFLEIHLVLFIPPLRFRQFNSTRDVRLCEYLFIFSFSNWKNKKKEEWNLNSID